MARIIVIDDDPEMRSMLESVLTSVGHEVAVAADGKEGVILCRAMPADLVITDLVMPNQEGMETIRELRRDYPTVVVIAMCGRPYAANFLSVAQQLGAARTIEKPFQPRELLDVVEEVLRLKPGAG